jgi:hypothetical protein
LHVGDDSYCLGSPSLCVVSLILAVAGFAARGDLCVISDMKEKVGGASDCSADLDLGRYTNAFQRCRSSLNSWIVCFVIGVMKPFLDKISTSST